MKNRNNLLIDFFVDNIFCYLVFEIFFININNIVILLKYYWLNKQIYLKQSLKQYFVIWITQNIQSNQRKDKNVENYFIYLKNIIL
jgi:hypothetical protein